MFFKLRIKMVILRTVPERIFRFFCKKPSIETIIFKSILLLLIYD